MKLLNQLKSAFDRGGLKSRDGSVSYKELLKDCEVPVMAIAGDRDLICPPSAVIGEIAMPWNVLCRPLDFNRSLKPSVLRGLLRNSRSFFVVQIHDLSF